MTERKFFLFNFDETKLKKNNQNHKILVIKTARTLRQITKTLQNFIKKTLNPHLKTKNM